MRLCKTIKQRRGEATVTFASAHIESWPFDGRLLRDFPSVAVAQLPTPVFQNVFDRRIREV